MCFYETVKINIFILPKADILRNYAEFKKVIQTAVTILVSELFNFCDMIVGFYGWYHFESLWSSQNFTYTMERICQFPPARFSYLIEHVGLTAKAFTSGSGIDV